MVRFWKRSTLAALLAGIALSAAGPSQAQAPNGFSWSGLYVGGNAGYAWSDIDWQYTGIAGPQGALTRDVEGGLFGLHVGLQHQWQSLVFGVEGSFSGGAGDKINDRGLDSPFYAATYDSYARVNSLLMLGGRVGWAPRSNWLLYTTAGWAIASIETSYILRGFEIVGGQDVERHNGFYIGGGVEYALMPNVIVGLEYVHVDLDSRIHSLSGGAGVERLIDPDLDIVRARLSFKLGRPAEVEPLK
jgi:outer membrane immunogenic protein